MKRKNVTRNALFTSIISLLLCVSMLVGTTFAWFTDEVNSGTNVIAAGNLDVELYHSDDAVTDEEVDSETKLFDDVDPDLWEPGALAYENFKVVNEGSLALKYRMSLKALEQSEVNGYKLGDVIKVGFNEDGFTATTREGLIGEVSKWQTLTEFTLDKNGVELAAGASDVFGLVLYWQPNANEIDNRYNVAGEALYLNVGVELYATQVEAEFDSFGDDYDADAETPATGTTTHPGNGEDDTSIEAGDVTVDVPANAEAGAYTVKVENKTVETNEKNETTVSFDISLLKDGTKVESDGTVYPVKISVGKNLEVTAVTHKGEAVKDYHYDPVTGIVSFETDSFSPFAVVYKEADSNSVFVPSDSNVSEKLEQDAVLVVDEDGNEYASLKAAIDSGASKLYCKEGADFGSITHLDIDHDLVIYGNGAKISDGERDLAIDTYKLLEKDITVTVYNLHGVAFWGQRNTGYTVNLNLYNCNDVGRVYINGTSGAVNINLVNCTANKESLVGDTVVYSNANGSVTVNGCTFTGIGCPVNLNHKIAGMQTVTVKNNKFVDCATSGTAAYYAPIRLYNNTEGANQNVLIDGNTFTYSEGKAPINDADVLLNKKHDGVDASGNITAKVQADAEVVTGVKVDVEHTVANAAELYALGYSNWNNGPYAKGTYVLLADIDMAGYEMKPIVVQDKASMSFLGNGHTISNLNLVEADVNGMAVSSLFSARLSGTEVNISNLTLENVASTSRKYASAVFAYNSSEMAINMNNVDVKNANIKGESAAALVAYTTGAVNMTGCDVSGLTLDGAFDENKVGAFIGTANTATCVVTVSNCTNNSSYREYGRVLGASVNGVIYNYVADGLYTDDKGNYYVYNANGLEKMNQMMTDDTAGRDVVVNLAADIDFNGKTWTPVDSHVDFGFYLKEFNGNGHTISNLTVNGQAMFTRFSCGAGVEVVIKDITFDKATVKNGNLNTAIVVGHTYNNVLLDNVDVKNSSITGNYKVAPLIGTVYNESTSSITATLKNCDVSNTTVHGNLDFMVAGMVAFVYETDNDKVVFENCTVTDVALSAGSTSYNAMAAVYCNDGDAEGSFDEVAGVTVTNVTKN